MPARPPELAFDGMSQFRQRVDQHLVGRCLGAPLLQHLPRGQRSVDADQGDLR